MFSVRILNYSYSMEQQSFKKPWLLSDENYFYVIQFIYAYSH